MLVLAAGEAGVPQLHRLRQPGGVPQPLTRGRSGVQRALWEPQSGEYIVFSRDTDGDEAWRLYRLDPDGREPPVPLTPAHLRVSDYAFLPEGRGLVAVLTSLDRRAARPPADADEGEGAAASATGPDPGARQVQTQLWHLNPRAPTDPPHRLLNLQGTRLADLRVLADGDVLLLHSGPQGSRYWRHSMRGEAARVLAPPAAEDGEAARPSATDSSRTDQPERVWMRQTDGNFRGLHLFRPDSGQRRRVPLGVAADLELVAPPLMVNQPLALVHNEEGLSTLRLFWPDEDRGRLQQLPGVPPGVIAQAAWHPRLPLLAFDHVSPRSPGRPWVFDLGSGELQPWQGSAVVSTRGGELQAEPRTLRWRSFDGTPVTALHIPAPPRFEGPRPVFIDIHGGPASQARPTYLQGTLLHLVQELGMHLVQPNVRGSSGFGRRFVDMDNGRQREDAVRDISSLLDYLATQPEMDTGRVIVSGGSYGGYMALAVAAAEGPRILGAISRVGISSFVSLLEHTESYRRDNRRLEYGDERDPAMREFLHSISPLGRVSTMRRPMFVVHGRNDPRVPWREADQIVQALRAQGTPVWFLTAEDEGHGFSKAHNREVLHHATIEFVRRLLQGEAIQ